MKILIQIPKIMHKETEALAEELMCIFPSECSSAADESDDSNDIDLRIRIVQDIKPQWILLKNARMELVFKIIHYKSRTYMGVCKPISKTDPPQLVVNNFTTDVGMKVAEFLMEMFPFAQESRQVANFTVEGDFLYFRLYKYCFGEKGPILENVGPHLTLRLWKLVEYGEGQKKVMNFKKFIKNACVL
ncbi:brix domain-containing protein [Ordospora colligata]|uniref:Brix domain-containing protein n=1 Tax=Ordospora colligata OC4 TaxID=1354746 RepID=A0A0B2UI92_9MICR|nr:brix domain-containing protein [Ordospora colligata OC4]KHN68959.1 brix domain-containing protein [Ordospora colligata OC4]TBU13993.1 brix domain-containing protein [Ordospora colligata]TBU14182.1 brix domain-containing protein [Ordospora colligata]TBU17851.1 brix domain-containing protein [Ordospora colligata]